MGNLKLFLSYRRGDALVAGTVGRIYDRLQEYYGKGQVFMDVDDVPPGKDFRKVLQDAVGSADILLTVIGPQWLKILLDRTENSTDFVQIEIEAALREGIPVLPLLIGEATMPDPTSLPPGIRDLAYCNALTIDPSRDFHNHVNRLIAALDEHYCNTTTHPETTDQPSINEESGAVISKLNVHGKDQPSSGVMRSNPGISVRIGEGNSSVGLTNVTAQKLVATARKKMSRRKLKINIGIVSVVSVVVVGGCVLFNHFPNDSVIDSGDSGEADDVVVKPGPQIEAEPPIVERASSNTGPGQFSTIQGAIDRAKPGEIVTIPNGTYEEMLELHSGIYLKAETAHEVIVQVDGNIGPALLIKAAKDCGVEGVDFRDVSYQNLNPDRIENKAKIHPLVFVDRSSVQLRDCTFSGIGDGVLLGGAGESVVTDCKAFKNTLSGYKVERGAQATFENCEAEFNGDHGYSITRTGRAVIKRSVASDNGGSGVYLDIEGRAVLEAVDCDRNAVAGILLMNGGNTLSATNSKAEGNVQFGIATSSQQGAQLTSGGGNNVEIDTVQITNNGTAGIFIENPLPESVIRYCTIKNNGSWGIVIFGSEGHEVLLTENVVDSHAAGIFVEGDGIKVEVVGNRATLNSTYGIEISGAVQGNVTGNICPNNVLGPYLPRVSSGDLIVRDNVE